MYRMMASDPAPKNKTWLEIVRDRVRERNDRESKPFVNIYSAYKQLWQKCTYLEAVRTDAKNNLALLEYETADIAAKGEFEQAARNCSRKVTAIHSELRPYNGTGKEKNEQNLCKTVFDQRKLLNNQEEEMKVAKLQLADSFNTLAKYEEERLRHAKTVSDLEVELQFLRTSLNEKDKVVATLKAENADLTNRIITEKNKSAKEIDEMNKLLSRANLK